MPRYRDHRQGRRCHVRVRSRFSAATGGCLLKVQSKGWRGRAEKQRLLRDPAIRGALDDEARGFVTRALAAADLDAEARLPRSPLSAALGQPSELALKPRGVTRRVFGSQRTIARASERSLKAATLSLIARSIGTDR
jgi:hypothetical protein